MKKAKEVKCFWCKEKGLNVEMECEEKLTGQFNKNGTEKATRKYFHHQCYSEYQKDKEFKQVEAVQLDKLYQYLLKLHDIDILDGRMMEKIQDLRNGTVKVNNKKIVRYKNGVCYDVILEAYKQEQKNIEWNIKNKNHDKKWNEFSYCFGIMLNRINDINDEMKRKEKQESSIKRVVKQPVQDYNNDFNGMKLSNKKKKDELDISNFL